MNKKNVWNNKRFGAVLLFFSAVILASFILRIIFYRFEFDPKYYPVDYGRFNYFSYFTIQSNFFICVYYFLSAVSIFTGRCAGIRRAQVGLIATTYILITGAVYCSGFPMGLTPPFVWDTPYHTMLNCIQVLHHVIIPLLTLAFWLMQSNPPAIRLSFLPVIGIYPFVYSVFCILRGAFIKPAFYAYPFYNPYFIADTIAKGKEIPIVWGYVTMLPLMIVGIGLFILVAFILLKIHNRQVKAKENSSN